MSVLPSEAVDPTGGARRSTVHSLYGIRLATEFPIQSHLGCGEGPADLTFSVTREAANIPGTDLASCESVTDAAERRPGWIYLDRLSTVDVISYPGIFDFYVWPDRVICHLLDAEYETKVEIALLGTVLSYWLERSGIPVLHASAVEIAGQAVAFLADNKGGKSSLAVAFLRGGYPMITDDILPLDSIAGVIHGCTGYPQMRLWPRQAELLVPECAGLEFIHPAIPKYRVPIGKKFGTFSDGPKPLRCIYLPERRATQEGGQRDESVKITPLRPQEGLRELQAKGVTPLFAEEIGLRAKRFGFFASLLRQVSIRRLTYPSGVEHLPAVREAILKDLAHFAADPA